MQPSLNLFQSVFPQVPRDAEIAELRSWARKLIDTLTADQTKKPEVRVVSKAYAATIALNPQDVEIFKTTTVHATGNATINLSNATRTGSLYVIITNDSTGGKVITFGTGFTSTGTLTGTADETALVHFVGDGTTFLEVSRTTGLT